MVVQRRIFASPREGKSDEEIGSAGSRPLSRPRRGNFVGKILRPGVPASNGNQKREWIPDRSWRLIFSETRKFDHGDLSPVLAQVRGPVPLLAVLDGPHQKP